MKKILLIFSISTLLIYSCKDEDIVNNPELASTQASRDHLLVEAIFNDVERVVEDGFLNTGAGKNCPTYNLKNTNSSDQDTMIINFGNGNSGCISYGNIKSGKIIILYTGGYRDSLSIMTTTFDNYHVNNNLVQGERIVTNQGRNSSGNVWFTIKVNNATIHTPNGTINWESIREREWINGIATFSNIFDDKYSVTGSSSGNSVNGNDFSTIITDPLTIDLACLLYGTCITKSGEAKIEYVQNGFADRIINYGDSICDCNINVTINGTTYPIVIN